MVKIFVGNVSEGTTNEELRAVFESFGEITECDVLNKFGFVHMAYEEEANAAIEALQGYLLNGLNINVELSTGQKGGLRGRGGFRGGRGSFRGRGDGFRGRGRGMFRGRGRGDDSGRYAPYGRSNGYDRGYSDYERAPGPDPYDHYRRPLPPPAPYRRPGEPYYERDPYSRAPLPDSYDHRYDPYERRPSDPYARPYGDPYDRRPAGPPPTTPARNDPYARPPPEYYNRDTRDPYLSYPNEPRRAPREDPTLVSYPDVHRSGVPGSVQQSSVNGYSNIGKKFSDAPSAPSRPHLYTAFD